MTPTEHQEFNRIASAEGRNRNFDISFLILDLPTNPVSDAAHTH
jgi:hypothetical protein